MKRIVEIITVGELYQMDNVDASSFRFENSEPESPIVMSMHMMPGKLAEQIEGMMQKFPQARLKLSIEADMDSVEVCAKF